MVMRNHTPNPTMSLRAPMTRRLVYRLAFDCSMLPLAALLIATPAVAQVAVGTGNQSAALADDAFHIQFRADTLIVTPILHVGLVDSVRSGVAGKDVRFKSYANYPAFIDKGEIRIFKTGQSPDAEPLAKLVVGGNNLTTWRIPDDAPAALYYVYRAYGREGKFDETSPQELSIVSQALAQDLDIGPKLASAGRDIVDQAGRRTISIVGLMASVTGRADLVGDRVLVSGQVVDVDRDGKFFAQQIVPRVGGVMNVAIMRDGQEIKRASQSFDAPRSDWFIVGQGDLTLGQSHASGPARQVSGDTLAQGDYAIGRAAFYAKGVTRNDVRITASIDSGETSLSDLFSNLDRKDPRALLRRLNSDQYYPTYGDDSTLVEDAPTQGRFYLRAARGTNQVVVGNFVTEIAGGELVQLDRGLFGALVDLNSGATTHFGERKARLTAFASDPSTVPGREEFRGTGGSLYFLKRQDISVGSERVRIEVRDRETGLILEARVLHAQQDYDFDPFQGRLTLLTPLASTAATGGVVREGVSSGNVPVLVVRYEYSPPIGSLSGTTIGGRGSVWVADRVRLGLTAQRDTVEAADQTLVSIDVLHRIAAGTYAKAEIAQSNGPGFGQSNSPDGGLSFTDIASPGANIKAQAWRAELALDAAEMANKTGDLGRASAYFEHFDRGFSSAGHLSPTQTQRWGVALSKPIGQSGSISTTYDELTSGALGLNRTGRFDLAKQYDANLGIITAKAGLRFEDRSAGVLYNSLQDGSRTDAAIEVGFAPRGTNWALHGFGQATLAHDASRSRNNRVGIGGKSQINERLSVASEISGGDGGFGADVTLNHKRGNGSEAYVGYTLFADRTDAGFDPQDIFTRSNRGTLTLGARQRFSDSFSVTGENRIGMGGTAPSLSRSFGLRYEPTQRLSITGSFENGKIDDATTGIFRRTAASLGLGFSLESVRVNSAIELRDERGVGRNQRVWLFRNNLSYGVNPSWRIVGQLNIARADTSRLSVLAAEFTDAMAGLAYRPVGNEKVNGLFRLQYFDDMGPAEQLTGTGQAQSPKQTSTIVSGDVNYDLSDHWTIGGKFGFRSGKVAVERNSNQFVSSNAHLGVVRVNYGVNKKWDVLVEGRGLWVAPSHDQRTGALVAVYRHLGNNVKVGVGYSWSDFSDDLTDQSYSSRGPFLNLIGKF